MEKYPLALYSPINSINKQYQLVKLPNGILCLLISDPSEKTASCSLTIASGSFNDPENLPGLAHLCEHMILAGGSKKYPSTTGFTDELSRNNGQRNAYTTGQETTFYFYMPNANMLREKNNFSEKPPFENLLNIFGSCFEEPLFKKNELNNEIFAIDNEHSGNKANQKKLMYHGARILSNKIHPFSRFATGNSHTLKNVAAVEKIDLTDELKKIIDDYFYGNNMTLCIKSSDSLNILVKHANNAFGAIKPYPLQKNGILNKFKLGGNSSKNTLFYSKNNSSDPNAINFSVLEQSWNHKIGNIDLFSNSENNMIFIKGKESSSLLRVVMPIFHNDLLKMSFDKKDLAKFCNYWVEIFGEESKGSFDNYLKLNGFVSSSLSFMSEFAINNDALVLELMLTKKGWKNLNVIISTFKNKFIKSLLDEHNIKPLAKAFSEHNSIDILKFLYQDVTQNPIKECLTYSSQVLSKSFKDFIDKDFLLKGTPFIFYKGDSYAESSEGKKYWLGIAKKWQQFLSFISSQDSLRFIITGNPETVDLGESTNLDLANKKKYLIDPHFGFSYYEAKLIIDADLENISDYKFAVASSNKFIPSIARNNNKTLFQALEASKKSHSEKGSMGLVIINSIHHTKPKLVSENEKYQLWVKDESHNTIFKSKSLLTINLINDSIKPSAVNTMFLEVLTEVIGINISTILYPAIKIGYSLSISPSVRGDINLKISIDGFTDGLSNILDKLITCIKDITVNDIDREVLKKARINVRNKFESAANENGFKLALIGLYIVLDKFVWNVTDRIDALENHIDMESFKEFVFNFVQNLKVSIIHHGDLGSKSSQLINKHLSNVLTNHLDIESSEISTLPCLFNIKNTPGTSLLPKGCDFIANETPSKDDPNNSICYFLQTGKFNNDKTTDPLGFNSEELFNLTKLVEFIFELHLVPDLRIKRHLGYIVAGGSRTLTDTFGLQISAMSSLTPNIMEQKISDYLYDLEYSLSTFLTEDTFKKHYINEFLKVLRSTGELGQILQDTSLPSDILQSVPANFIMSSDCLLQSQYNFHKKLVESLILKRYNFEDLNYDDTLNLEFISSIKLSKFLEFFKHYVSIESPNRSKLSIHISTKMTEKEINKKMISMQINGFLKMKGFNFDPEEIEKIVDKNKTNTTGILKDFYSYFSAQGDGMKFLLAGVKEMIKAIAGGLVQTSNSSSASSTTTSSSKNNVLDVVDMIDKNKNTVKSNGIKQKKLTDSNYFRNKEQII